MAAARARPVVLLHAGAVLAMTSALDTTVPNMARIYNYWLGGKDHFAADRAQAERLVELYRRCPRWSGRTGRSSSRLPAGQPGRGSGSSSTWVQGFRHLRRSTRQRGRFCPRPGSPMSTSTRWSCRMP
jgi:hypothetical protein